MGRLTIFAGHYGSGKTNVAVNYALARRREGSAVRLCDLDIVNPYFRTADAAQALADAGITLIASAFANSSLESPALPPGIGAAFDDADCDTVIDVGGDDAGIAALGRYAEQVKAVDYDLWLVANCYRLLARHSDDALVLLREMEHAAHLTFTGIVNNNNLGVGTTLADIEAGLPYIDELAQKSKLPVVFTSLKRDLAPQWTRGETLAMDLIENRFGIF